jgi:hypothetical protein
MVWGYFLYKKMTYKIKQLRSFKGALFTFMLLGSIVIYSGCSSSTTPSDQSSLTTSTEMQNSTVSAAHVKSSPTIAGSGLMCDSIVISRARILISTMKLHRDENDTLGEGTVKVGPFIAEFNASGATILSKVTIPPGTYDRIKFEMHKLNDKDDATLLNDALFGDFVNGGRYTAIIDGKAYVNGVGYAFSFKTSKTDNVTVFVNPPAAFSAGSSYNLALVFDPKLVFAEGGSRPLDPRSTDNQHAIEDLIKDALKALKK